jgi:hypothetical protein
MKFKNVSPSGLCLFGDSNPDLTAGAIASRPFGTATERAFPFGLDENF